MTIDIDGPGRGGTQILAVDKLGITDKVLKMYKDGKSANYISDFLASTDIKISPQSINKWLKKQKRRVLDKQKSEIVSYKKFEMMCIDYQKEITVILDEVKETKNLALKQGKLDTYVKLVEKLYRGLELLVKLMGDIKPSGAGDVNIIINEISKDMFKENRQTRNKLYGKKVFDVEAEIVENDKQAEEKIKGDNK